MICLRDLLLLSFDHFAGRRGHLEVTGCSMLRHNISCICDRQYWIIFSLCLAAGARGRPGAARPGPAAARLRKVATLIPTCTILFAPAMHCCSGVLPAECTAWKGCCTLLGESCRASSAARQRAIASARDGMIGILSNRHVLTQCFAVGCPHWPQGCPFCPLYQRRHSRLSLFQAEASWGYMSLWRLQRHL